MGRVTSLKFLQTIINVINSSGLGRCGNDLKTLITEHMSQSKFTFQWHHNERDGVSNHQPHECLRNCLFRHKSKKTPKLHVTDLWQGNSPVTGEFPTQRASKAKNVSLWWHHHYEHIVWNCSEVNEKKTRQNSMQSIRNMPPPTPYLYSHTFSR